MGNVKMMNTVYTSAQKEYTVKVCVCKLVTHPLDFILLLKALFSLALSASHAVLPFCSSCYLKNFIHSVGEALYDPVLQHSLRFDFDMNLYACVSVLVCLRAHVYALEIYHGEATLSQASASAAWLHGLFIHSHWIDPLFTVPPGTV